MIALRRVKGFWEGIIGISVDFAYERGREEREGER